MIRKAVQVITFVLTAFSMSQAVQAADRKRDRAMQSKDSGGISPANLTQSISGWPERPRVAALQMAGKYGPPQQVTSEKLVWDNAGPYKRITVTKKETHHDFPKPHMDFLQHTVAYQVPADKADEISAFDGSATFNRTDGELSGKCDLEGHNILTLNLAHDIATGKKTAQEARKAFSDIVVEDMMGKNPPYVMALQFQPAADGGMFADKPTIPGSPVRVLKDDNRMATGQSTMGDAEVLCFIVALNENEIVAAAHAQQEKVSFEIMAYAKKLHQEHGKNLGDTMKLGEKIKVTPVETAAVDAFRVKGAGELAMLVPLDGDEFGRSYVRAMAKGHQEALEMIDNKLLPMVQNDQLKQHLTMTRGHIAKHLDEAKQLESRIGR